MINFNGTIYEGNQHVISHKNRSYKIGDVVFETIKVVGETIYFLEDHYFRLMAGMRIMRMQIPLNFTLDFFANEILKLVNRTDFTSSRIRLSVSRGNGGAYLAEDSNVEFLIEITENKKEVYSLNKETYTIDVYKDFKKNKSLLGNFKTHLFHEHILANIYAQEYDFDNCVLINYTNHIVEAINGNIFLVKEGKISTPKLTDGCIDGVIRKNIFIIAKEKEIEIEEREIFPFELVKADEVFITNVIKGIVSVTNYKRAMYSNTFAQILTEELNEIEHKHEIS